MDMHLIYILAKYLILKLVFIRSNDCVSSGETKRCSEGDGMKREGWGKGIMPVLVKNCSALNMVWAGALVNHPA